MLRISVLIFFITVVAGCYPPTYYDYWNARSVERYLDRAEASSPVTYTYPVPYYSLAPYPYWPFFFSLSYSDFSYHREYPYRNYYRRGYPYPGHFDYGRHKRR